MSDSVNLSLDEIIKQNKSNKGQVNRGRGRGGRGSRGRGRGRGGGRRSRSQQRSASTEDQQRSRSRSRLRSQSRGRSRSRARSQSRARSRSRSRANSVQKRARSTSRPRIIGLDTRGRGGRFFNSPQLIIGKRNRGQQARLKRFDSENTVSIHDRLGLNKPLAVAKRGISKRGRNFNTGNRFSTVGLRSDQMLRESRMLNDLIKSQTFRRTRNNSFASASQLTVSVANDFAKKRRNSFGNSSYLNKQSLALLNQGFNKRRGPGSVKSVGSARTLRSNRSSSSQRFMRSNRGRGRRNSRGVGRNFVNQQKLNPKLQQEIAAIQGKAGGTSSAETPSGVNFSPTPAVTTQTLHQRFACV